MHSALFLFTILVGLQGLCRPEAAREKRDISMLRMGKRGMKLLRMGRSAPSEPSAYDDEYADNDVIYIPPHLAAALQRFGEERGAANLEDYLEKYQEYLEEMNDSDPIRQIGHIPRLGRHARDTEAVEKELENEADEEKSHQTRALPRLGLREILAKLASRTTPLPRLGYRENALDEDERALPRLGMREQAYERALPRLGFRETEDSAYTHSRAVPLPRLGLKSIERAVPLPRLGVRDLDEEEKEEEYDREARSDGSEVDEEKRGMSMLRMGKRAMGMLRMGRSDGSDPEGLDEGKRAMGMLRMGRSMEGDDEKRAMGMLRMGKKAMGMLRMGRSMETADENDVDEDKRAVSMLRMGKRGMSMLRMGRSGASEPDEDKRAMGMLRMGRSMEMDEEKRGMSMLRMGKRPVSMLRMGKRPVSMLRMGKRPVSMLRMGKRSAEDTEQHLEEQTSDETQP